MKCWWVHLGKYSIWVPPCLLTTTSSILLLAQHQIIAVGANQHLLSKMMQKALKNNTQLAWTTPHNSILCNRKKWWFSNIYILHIATTWLCYFWHLDFFFFLSQLFIGVLSQNLPHPNTKNNTKYSKKECFYFSVKYDSP